MRTIFAFLLSSAILTLLIVALRGQGAAAQPTKATSSSSSSSATVASAKSVLKVVFSWTNDRGVRQSLTDTKAPYNFPQNHLAQPVMFPYLSTPGNKTITASIYYSDGFVKNETVSFTIIDTRPSPCQNTNLIENAGMDYGPEGYWEPATNGRLVKPENPWGRANSGIQQHRQSNLRGSPVPRTGPTYVGTGRLDTSCLRPGTTWNVYGLVGLYNTDTKTGGMCTPSKNDCPTVIVTIRRLNGSILFQHRSKWTNPTWNPNWYNEVKSTFTLPPSSQWNGYIGSVTIHLGGYNGTAADYILDQLDITPA